MNSVSMPSRPVARARSASPATVFSLLIAGGSLRPGAPRPRSGRAVGPVLRRRVAMRVAALALVVVRRGPGLLGRRLVGPVAVLVEVRARAILGHAVAVAADPDAVEPVQQPHRQPGADEQHAALQPALVARDRHQDQAGDDDPDRQPGAAPAHAPDGVLARRAHAVTAVRPSGCKRATSSAGEGHSPGSARPTEAASSERTSAASWPSGARSAGVTAPWRLARRSPSGPSMRGTWAWRGAGRPSRAPSHSWRGVESRRSAPRTTSSMPWAASSTTTARL